MDRAPRGETQQPKLIEGRVSVSLVVYRTSSEELTELFTTLSSSPEVRAWIVVDNAASEDAAGAAALRQHVKIFGGRYVAAPRNLGFGAGHNLALQHLADAFAEHHLMVNPDVTFEKDVLPALADLMDSRPTVGWTMPRVLYPDGKPQHLCKLLPTPMDFFARRFVPARFRPLFQSRLDRYEMRGMEEVEMTGVPFLSGCFVMARRSVLEAVGGFDDRYFLYLEDVDLCRRMAAKSDLLYWPHVAITHGYHRGSHRSRKLMWIFIRSAIAYFNKWGWFFDRERDRANASALAKLDGIQGT